MNVAAEALSRSKIRMLVKELRKVIGCDEIAYFPIIQFIEWILANPEWNGLRNCGSKRNAGHIWNH